MTRIFPATWDLSEKLAARVGKTAGRQRVIAEGGDVLAVLHRPPAPDDEARVPFVVWRDASGTWRGSAAGKEGPIGQGLAALSHHLGLFADRLSELDARADAAASASDHFAVLGAAQPLHRTLRNAHRALQELRERLAHEPELVPIRDRAYELERTAELLVEDAKNGLEFTIAKQSEAQAKVAAQIADESRRLNLLAAICLPISALQTLVGASLMTGLEGLPQPLTFWVLLGGAVLLGLGLRQAITRREARGAQPAR
jgi:hypothetical protein